MTSLPVRSRTEKSEDLDQLSREVLHRDVSQYQPLSPAEVSKAISGSPLSSVEKAGILTAFSKLLVVKFFADASMLKDVLKSGNFRGKVLEALIEKANAAMRTGFKELISYAKDAISSFAKEEEEGKEIVSGYNRRRSLNAWVGSETKQEGEIEERAEVEKELARERFAALCPQATDSSTETDSRKVGDPSSSKRPSVLDAPPGHTPVPPPLDLEALEARYIRSTRLQLRSSSSQQPPVPPPKRLISSSASVGRLRRLQDRDINPSAERAKSLLKDFLDTERKIMVVRCAERVTLKSHSARNTPTVKRYHRFQVGSPLKAKPSKLEVRKRLMRSHTMLGGERFGRLAGL